jgi:plastocyanin
MNRGFLLRIGAAIAVLISGIVHLDLYFNHDYRFASADVNFGRSILLNAVASGVVAVLLVAFREWFVKVIAVLLPLGTIVIFFYTHAENEFLGYTHGGPTFEPSPQAQVALIAQLAAIVLIVVSFLPGMEDESVTELNVPAIGTAFVLSAVALVGLTLKWKPKDMPAVSTAIPAPSTSAPGAGAGAVTIKGFAFSPADLAVPAGATITWTNEDGATHDIVFDDPTIFVSKDLGTGDSDSTTLSTPGTFAYTCGIHPRMKGTVTVTG